MNKLLIFCSIILLTSTICFGQSDFKRFIKRNSVTWSCMAVAGVADGVNEVLRYDYASFQRTFPGANPKFWDPAISWRNKYQNGDPAQGPAFTGSTTIFVSFTDGNHLTRLINHTCLIGGIVICPGGKKEKWYWYVADFASSMLIYKGAMTITYEAIRK